MSDLAPFNVSDVTHNLLVGGGIVGPDEMPFLQARGVTDVICVAAELDDAAFCAKFGMGYRHVSWADDGHAKDRADFLYTLTWVLEQALDLAKSGKALGLYVHCAAGVNRGPTMATFLLAALAGLSTQGAWELVRGGRPEARGLDVPAYRASVDDALGALRSLRPAPAMPAELTTLANPLPAPTPTEPVAVAVSASGSSDGGQKGKADRGTSAAAE